MPLMESEMATDAFTVPIETKTFNDLVVFLVAMRLVCCPCPSSARARSFSPVHQLRNHEPCHALHRARPDPEDARDQARLARAST
jgi:hypothetical protein